MSEPYLAFQEVANPGKKTRIWTVKTAAGGLLGEVKWWPAWRRYTFQPSGYTVFDSACLGALQEFLDAKMTEWAVERGA